jgi:hypothetical protein
MKLNVFSLINMGVTIATLSISSLQETAVMAQTGAIWYNCLTREVWTPEKKAWCDRWKTLKNATYLVPASLTPNAELMQVTLKNGRYQRQDGKFFVELVNEKNWLTFGDLNGDGKQDAAVIFGVALDPNGKAIGTYLTAVLDVDGKPRAIAPIRLGGRIMLNGPIEIDNNSVTVPLLTQKEVINRVYVIQEALQERQ